MNRPCPDCTEKGHPGFRDPRHSDAFCRTCEGEGEIDPIQSSRDQGIADACAGRAPWAWLTEGALFVGGRNPTEAIREIEIDSNSREYRSAFAYARAFEQNRIDSKGGE